MRAWNAAVIGHPIGHTMSPFLHERLFRLSGLPLAYQVLDLPDLEKGLPALRKLDGFNITIPHKTAILPFLDGMEEKAKACGSVNTVRVTEGKLYGTTTDGAGCLKALERHGMDVSGKVLLLGNGGAARALAFEIAFAQPGFHLIIACRGGDKNPKARALGDDLAAYARGKGDRDFRITVESYEELGLDTDRYSLLINATSVGMYPNTAASPVPQEVVARCGAVFDAVYNPAETELLNLAESAGVKGLGGMEMLVYQAVEAHRFWYGASFREEDLSQLCRDAQEEMDRLFHRGG